MRRAAKRDAVEVAIADGLRQGGAYVELVSAPRLPDAFVIFGAHGQWLEFKGEDGRMTQAQVELHAEWERRGVFIPVVSTLEEAWTALRRHRFRTYRDFPWEGVPEAEKRKRLALQPTGR